MLLFLSATGITWSLYAGATVSDIRASFGWQGPQLDTALPHTRTAVRSTWTVWCRRPTRPGCGHRWRFPCRPKPNKAAGVTEIDKAYRLTTNSAAVYPATLSVTRVVDYGRDYSVVAKLADWGIRMHRGFLFGWLNQLLLLAVAVGW